MNLPAVSVVMAVKDAERYLAAALDSVAAQTFRDFEIVVVDGASTDESVRIAKSYPTVTCIPQNGTGFANAWNQGIEIARASLISFLDSDDLWPPEKLALQVAYLKAHPGKGYVIGRVQFFTTPGEVPPPGFKPALMNGTHVASMPGTIMIRRSVFELTGLFESHWQIMGDTAWFQKLRKTEIEAGFVDRVLLRKRVHSNNLSYSTNWAIYRRELFSLLKNGLDRGKSGPAAISSRQGAPIGFADDDR
jgi:glycosyltransferase involved in cell wall biosynthesis